MMKPFPIDISGGVNLLDDPRRVAPNEVVKAQNIVPVNPGVYGTRPALSFVQAVNFVLTATIWSSVYKPFANTSANLVSAVTAVPGNNTLFNVTRIGGSGSAADMGVPVADPWLTLLANKVFVLPGPGGNASAYTAEREDGPDVAFDGTSGRQGQIRFGKFAFAGTGNGDLRPKLVTGYRSRFVWANFGPGFENTLVFSDNFKPDTIGNDVLAVNGRNVALVSTYDGDEIVGMIEVMTSNVGSPAQAALLVLRRRSAFLLTGEPDQTGGGTNSLVVNRMAIDTGCVSPRTITKTPYGVLWASDDDVWLFDVGSVPRPVGTKIRKALSQSPRAMTFRWRATYFDGFFRLMVHSEGQGPTERSPLGEQWWLDLRRGAPRSMDEARWWGPQIYYQAVAGSDPTLGTSNWLLSPREPEALYGIEMGIGQGGLPQFNMVSYGVVQSRDTNIDLLQPLPASVGEEIGDEILIDLLTREFDFDDPRNPGLIAPLEKSSDGMDFALWNSETARLQVDVIANGGEQTVSANIDQTDAGFKSGVTQLDGGTMFRKPQGQSANPQPRPVATTFQYRIRNMPGYLINDSNDTLTVLYSPDGIVSAEILRITAEHGLYATINNFGVAWDTAFTTTSGQVWTFNYDTLTALFSLSPTSVGPVISVQLTGSDFSYATTEEAAENRRILAMMGLDTSLDLVGEASLQGTGAVYQKLGAIWEFSGLSATVEVFPRRP